MKLLPLNPRSYPVVVALVVLALLALAAIPVAEGAQRAPAASSQAASARQLAGDRGCTVCHRDANARRDADEALPLAPGWDEIAARCRNHAHSLVRWILSSAPSK